MCTNGHLRNLHLDKEDVIFHSQWRRFIMLIVLPVSRWMISLSKLTLIYLASCGMRAVNYGVLNLLLNL